MEAASDFDVSAYTFAIRLVFEKCDIWSGLMIQELKDF